MSVFVRPHCITSSVLVITCLLPACPSPAHVSAGLVSEQKSQTEEAGARLAEISAGGCDAGPQGAAGRRARPAVQHGSTVLHPAPGSHPPPVPHAALRDVLPPPGPGRPVPLPRRPTSAGHPAAAWRLVRPSEGQPHLTHVLSGLHAASGAGLSLELRSNTGLFKKIRCYIKMILKTALFVSTLLLHMQTPIYITSTHPGC